MYNSVMYTPGDTSTLANYYPGCKACGSCCHLTLLSVSLEEVACIKEYVAAQSITALDFGSDCCPFLQSNHRCAVYPVRPQTCRLYNCKIPRKELLKEHPEIYINEQQPLIDLRQTFVREL